VNGERLVAAAAQQSLSRSPIDKHLDPEKWPEDKVKKWIDILIVRGYHSPLEHSVYTFYIEGCSRVCSHQLVRHRIASYTQYSQRWKKTMENYVLPPTVTRNEKLREMFIKTVEEAFKVYNELIEEGVPPEDARYILPQAVTTKIIVTMNARELLHVFSLRTCVRAQWEIRYVAWKMLYEVLKVHPLIFTHAGPTCLQTGKCPEGVPSENFKKCVMNSLNIVKVLGDQEVYNTLIEKLNLL